MSCARAYYQYAIHSQEENTSIFRASFGEIIDQLCKFDLTEHIVLQAQCRATQIVERNSFLVLFNFENERLLEQFVTIRHKYRSAMRF